MARATTEQAKGRARGRRAIDGHPVGRRVAIVLASLILVGAVGLGGPSTAPAKPALTLVQQSLPGNYLVGYAQRARACRDLVTPPWVGWLSYANATVSDEWRVYASSRSLCGVGRTTADAVITAAPFDDGAGKVLSRMMAFALHHHRSSLENAPRPAGRPWKCGVLPSFWGQQAWDLARVFHHPGSPLESDFASASGPAAGAGYCERGARANRTGSAQWRGGQFFTWSPDTRSCMRHYTLKEVPDPANPGQTKNPPFPAALWGDYDLVSC